MLNCVDYIDLDLLCCWVEHIFEESKYQYLQLPYINIHIWSILVNHKLLMSSYLSVSHDIWVWTDMNVRCSLTGALRNKTANQYFYIKSEVIVIVELLVIVVYFSQWVFWYLSIHLSTLRRVAVELVPTNIGWETWCTLEIIMYLKHMNAVVNLSMRPDEEVNFLCALTREKGNCTKTGIDSRHCKNSDLS